MKTASAAALAVLLLIGSILGSYQLSLYTLSHSQHQWCTTLQLLTAQPVPRPADPAANPSREDAWLFWTHLRQLERDFGC